MDIRLLENEAGKEETVEKKNGYFASVFTVEETSNIPELQENQGTEVSVLAITKEKMLGKLKGLKVDKSLRPDGLYPRVLKEIAEEICGGNSGDLSGITGVREGPRGLENNRRIDYFLNEDRLRKPEKGLCDNE
eukprot:g32056.t1